MLFRRGWRPRQPAINLFTQSVRVVETQTPTTNQFGFIIKSQCSSDTLHFALRILLDKLKFIKTQTKKALWLITMPLTFYLNFCVAFFIAFATGGAIIVVVTTSITPLRPTNATKKGKSSAPFRIPIM